MDIQTSGQEQGQQEHNDKVEGEVVVGRKQLKPNVVNISFKYETSGGVKEECKGTRKGGGHALGRLRELGYVTGGSDTGCNADGQIRVRSAHKVCLNRKG